MSSYNAHVPVDCCYPLVRVWLEQLTGHELLQREYHTVLAPYSHCCAAILDCLYRVFDLMV